jgi:hypothetical protein
MIVSVSSEIRARTKMLAENLSTCAAVAAALAVVGFATALGRSNNEPSILRSVLVNCH